VRQEDTGDHTGLDIVWQRGKEKEHIEKGIRWMGMEKGNIRREEDIGSIEGTGADCGGGGDG
jgi:hypothetical protein